MNHLPNRRDLYHDQAPSRRPARSVLAKTGSFLLTQLLGLVVFVGFPALVTAVAPVSWIEFTRRDGQVSATSRTCLLFVVPFRVQYVSPVMGLGDRFVGGTTSYDSRRPHRRSVKSEDEGFFVIHGQDKSIEVQVTPINIKSVNERSAAFLNNAQANELKLFVVANWKFSVVVGGLISLLTVLYALTWIFGLVIQSVRAVQWLGGVPAEHRWLAKSGKEAA